MSILGIDYGTVRVGLSLAREGISLAFPLETVRTEDALKRLPTIIEEESIKMIILGIPINLKGEKAIMAQNVELFKKELEQKTSVPIKFQDERLTSVSADKLLSSAGLNGKKKRKIKDQHEATLILQSYLDSNR
jgi:putative holliday junction resolvase